MLRVTELFRSGLPGNVGSILVSRLSTALHANEYEMDHLPHASTEDLVKTPSAPPPSTRLVMITLIGVTFPIEIAFLATLRAIGWLHVPAIFLIFSVAFFCIAVRTSPYVICRAVNLTILAGRCFPFPRSGSYRSTVETQARPRHVRPSDPLGPRRPHRPITACRVL